MKDEESSRRPNQRPNHSLFAMLGLLSLGPQTGYELRKLSEESIRHFWRESYGQIYPSLKELERRGWATRRVEEGQGRPDRQVYALTEAGEEALRAWAAVPARPEVPRNELLLKTFFGRRAPAGVLLGQIEEHRLRLMQELQGYEATEAQIRAGHAGHPDLPYWLMTLSYGKRYTQAEIAWCDEAAGQLKEIEVKQIEERGTTAGTLA
jgi:DNA-binding PadR family transcriptional regulator